jgi:hypothetical protein
MENKFFVLEIGRYTQYKFAWYEVTKHATYSTECPRCPFCGGSVGSLYWLPPYEIILKQPRHVGDFVLGAGGCDLLVSERFMKLYEHEKLTGIDEVLPITVVRMGTSKKSTTLKAPKLYGLYLQHTRTQLKYEEMGITWGNPPKADYCTLCGPGGGGKNGWWKSRERIVVDSTTWKGEDLFYAINHSGTILLSEKAAQLVKSYGLTNASVIPCEEAKFAYS